MINDEYRQRIRELIETARPPTPEEIAKLRALLPPIAEDSDHDD